MEEVEKNVVAIITLAALFVIWRYSLIDKFSRWLGTLGKKPDPEALERNIKNLIVVANAGKKLHNNIQEWVKPEEVPNPIVDDTYTLPDKLRPEHIQVIGGTGSGKTSALISMFLDDLADDAAMVLIDSQGDLIEKLAVRVPQDRLILVDPECPPAMNVFDLKDRSEAGVSRALTTLTYLFSTTGMAMTAKQSMAYSYISRLCMTIPGANIRTFRNLLSLDKLPEYQQYIDALDEDDRDFWTSYTQTRNNEYGGTREEIRARVNGLLRTPMFAKMLGANEMKLDIPEALEQGKIILVNTSTNLLNEASPIIGRLFIAQVMQAVRNRPQGNRKRVYLYVDEFADFADDSKMLTDCFKEGRKYNLAMMVCFQLLQPLSEGIRAFIAGNTSIKLAGGVSPDDIAYMAKQMQTTVQEIQSQPAVSFLAYIKGEGTRTIKFDNKRIERVSKVTNMRAIYERMRAQYGEVAQPKPKEPPEPFEEAF